MSLVTLYTTAPSAYDGFSTRELEADAGRDNRGLTVRKVALEARDLEWQTSRYGSGLHACATPEDAARFPSIWRLAAPACGITAPSTPPAEGPR
jgi:hypothetical protein